MKGRRSCSGSFLGLLFLLFLILRLTHVIDWSWWWVTSPLWLPLALAVGVLLLVGLLGLVGFKIVTNLGRKRVERARGPQAGAVVDAAGAEVKASPTAGAPAAALPAATPPGADPPVEEPPVETSPATGGRD